MPSTFSPRPMAQRLGIFSVTIGTWGALCWLINLPEWGAFLPRLQPIAFSTSISLILLGLLLKTMAESQKRSNLQFAAWLLPLLMGWEGMATWISPMTPGVDRVLLQLWPGAPTWLPISTSMSPMTGACLVLLSAALGLLTFPGIRFATQWTTWLGAAVASFSFAVILGYAHGAPIGYHQAYIPVSLPAALAMVSLGIGLVAVGQTTILQRKLFSSTWESLLLRRLLPALLAAYVLGQWLERVILVRTDPGLQFLFIVSLTAILTALIAAWTAKDIGKAFESSHREAREARNRYQAIINQSIEAICLIDPETKRVTEANPAFARLLGYSEEEIQVQALDIYRMVPQDPLIVNQLLKEFLDVGFGRTPSFTLKKKDGSTVDVIYSAKVITLDDKRMILSMISDRSEVTALESQLSHIHKMEAIGQLAGGVAHDFNNLLTAITGYGQLISNTFPPDHPIQADLGEIRQAADRAATLTQQLLAFSRKQIIQPVVLDLNQIIRQLEKLLLRIMGEDIKLLTVYDENPCPLKADPHQIEQVIMNLVVNARDAMPRGGRMTIAARRINVDGPLLDAHPTLQKAPHALLEVRDSGHGIPKDIREKIFEPYFTTKEIGRGTGLGLSTVYGIVKQSGGEIWLESEVGQGTIFFIAWPLSQTAPLEQSPEPFTPPPNLNGQGTILLVEDDDAIRRIATLTLTKKGYRVLAANNGEDALKLLREAGQPIHLLVTDMVMPGLNGREVAERFRRHHPKAKIILMSGYSDHPVLQEGRLEASTIFLQKPFSPDQLLTKVREVLKN